MTFELTRLQAFWLCCAALAAVLALWGGTAGLPVTASERIAAVVIALWSSLETMVRRNWWAFLTLPALLFGAGCALPLYLYMRSRPIV